jgi:hypothetical protein
MIYKKVVGSFVFLFVILGISLAGYYFVQAKFINSQNLLEFDGLLKNISSEGGDKAFLITLQTSGGTVIMVHTDSSTNYVGNIKRKDLDDAIHNFLLNNIDMRLRIVADIVDNEAYAKSIKKVEGVGYGFEGDHVQITRAMVIDKGEDLNGDNQWFKVDTGVAEITFRVITSTDFSGITFEDLKAGNIVQIHGRDSGNVFLASLVVLKEKNINTYLTK